MRLETTRSSKTSKNAAIIRSLSASSVHRKSSSTDKIRSTPLFWRGTKLPARCIIITIVEPSIVHTTGLLIDTFMIMRFFPHPLHPSSIFFDRFSKVVPSYGFFGCRRIIAADGLASIYIMIFYCTIFTFNLASIIEKLRKMHVPLCT